MSFEALWLEMEGAALTQNGVMRRRVLPEAVCDLFVGIEHPGRRRVFLLRVAEAETPALESAPQARGVEMRIGRLSDDPPDCTSVTLALADEAFRDIFSVLVDDIAIQVGAAATPRAAVERFLSRLARWQAFLERFAPGGLSDTAQRGLFGEFWFRRSYLLPAYGPEIVSAWMGPKMVPQDFHLPGLAIEVKTTSSKQHQKLRIAGERQLETSAGLRIIISHLSLDAHRDTGLSLVEIVAEIRRTLSTAPLALTQFNEGLLEGGYLDAQSSRYSRTGYIEREHHFFEVRGDFPRIVGADLRAGVGDVFYSISVAECLHYEMTDADFRLLLTAAL
jgi:Putative  PD-(D/E)XK family member, (DUF4420)